MSGQPELPTLLLGAPMSAHFVRRLAQQCEVIGPLPGPFPEAVVALPRAKAQRVRILLTLGTARTTREALGQLPALGLVCCYGSGYEGVDLVAAAERGIAVTHSPGANASAVADFAVGLMIASIRKIVAGQAFLLRGDWAAAGKQHLPMVRGLTGRRVGIFGLGAIGEKVARRVAAFEMEVGYHNRGPRADVRYPWFATLRELAQWADVLIVAVRAGAGNRHAVNQDILAALGADGHVVNIARGSVIDEPALIAALRDGVIAGAGLDVFEHEPQVPPELLALPNVVLSPHQGGAAREAQSAMQDMVCANVEAFLAGNAVPTPVPGAPVAQPAGSVA